MKRTYLVHLADRDTGQDQRILVRSDTSEGMQEFVLRADLHPALEIANPVVIAVRELAINRPLPRTTLASFVA